LNFKKVTNCTILNVRLHTFSALILLAGHRKGIRPQCKNSGSNKPDICLMQQLQLTVVKSHKIKVVSSHNETCRGPDITR